MGGPASAPEQIRFCPRCGNELITRPVGDKLRRACLACDYIHFTDPKVGVGVLVLQDGKMLLIKRGMAPELGKWSIPAGFLDQGEDPRLTAAREVQEETGLTVVITGLIDVYHNPPGSGGASIFILFQGEVVGGALQAGDDAKAAGFFGPGELPELAFSSTRDAVGRFLDGG